MSGRELNPEALVDLHDALQGLMTACAAAAAGDIAARDWLEAAIRDGDAALRKARGEPPRTSTKALGHD